LVLSDTKESDMAQKKDSLSPGGTKFERALKKFGLLLVALVLAASVGSAGCIGANNPKATRAIKVLEEKYGEPFELKSYSRWAKRLLPTDISASRRTLMAL
jgi:hypothetical protein